ncbi:alpha/beta hydrolase family protein [Altererythrobacter sp.]|uniref:alpha/beta hydrolase family protein n=1 Tax=Altererythrobacter sp. TaxID=1872480 RepID=UPI003D0CC047
MITVLRNLSLALSMALLGAIATPSLASPPPLEAYGSLPEVEDAAISPSGQRYAFLMSAKGARQLLIVGPDKKVLKSIAVGDVKVRSFDFVTDDLIMLQRSSTEKLGHDFAQDKFEFYQAVLIPVQQGGEMQLVFGDRRSLVNAVFGYYGTRWIDGRPVAFFGAIELRRSDRSNTGYEFQHGRPALYSVDLLSNDSRHVATWPPEYSTRHWLVGASGSVIATLDISKNSGRWSIDGPNGKIASGRNPAGDVFLVSIGKDGSTIIYGSRDETTDITHWHEVPIDGSRPPEVIYDDVDIIRIYRDRKSGHMIGYVTETEQEEPFFFNATATKRAKAIKQAFATYRNRMIDWTEDFGHVLVRTDGNHDSGTYFAVDLTTNRADAIAYERLAIGPDAVGAVSKVTYKANDGLEMDGILTLPPGKEPKNLPLVLLPHGGPHSHNTEGFDWWAQAFASRGFAVFQPNFRGSTNRGEPFIQAGYGQWGRKMQTDISDGMAALAEKGIIDPKRACIVGASYGGYAALAGVTLQQGLYRCAVSVAGVSDLSLMSRIENRERGNSKIARRSLEEELGPRSGYREISPRFNADRADAPILLIHGRDDTVVEYQQSQKMADALKDAGKPYEFVELKGEDHWLSLSDTRKAMLKAAVGFVMKHNPPD